LTKDNTNKKPLRIVLIASECTIREYTMFLEHLLVGLADESVPVALVCPSKCDIDSVVTGAAEIIRYPVFELPLMEHFNRRLLSEQLSKFKPTTLHCLCESKAGHTRRLARRLNLPYILTINSLEKRILHLSVSLKRCVKILVPAKTIATSIAKVHPNFSDRIEQINIGTFATETQACFSKPSGQVTLVTTYQSGNANEFVNLLSAVKHLLIDGYEFMMIIISSGSAERKLWKLLAALDLLQTVTIVPKLKPWHLVLATGDIFIRSEPTSAFNPILLEAMGVGTAIAGCRSGVDDLIIEDETAVVFDPNDELSIMHNLKRLLDRHEFARQIAQNAQQYVRENHTVSQMISSILKAYTEVYL
jgi:glycosyltransferase involved in cell wall biosynthesis